MSDHLGLFLENIKGLSEGYFCPLLTPYFRDASLSQNSPCNTNAVFLLALFQFLMHITSKALAKLLKIKPSILIEKILQDYVP